MRKHARHYRRNSFESMELVRFLRGLFMHPPYRCIGFTRRKIDRPAFLRPFYLAHRAPNATERRIEEEKKRGRDGTVRRKNNRSPGTSVCAKRPTVINWREKRREGGGEGASRVGEKPMSPGRID